jgi:hypothetical protein
MYKFAPGEYDRQRSLEHPRDFRDSRGIKTAQAGSET